MAQNKTIGFAFAFVAALLIFLFLQRQGIEGGQDSWQHFLISKYALKYPELLLDQWNKPVFTWFTVFVCQAGMDAMIIFNIFCSLISGLLISLALQKNQIKNAWLAIPFLAFCPIMFGNTISCLTEPLNVLLLSLFFYLWFCKHFKSAVALASILPFVRTEGFVICGAIFLIILYHRQYKLLFWLLIGSVIMNVAGFAVTGKPFWIITENPYLKFEQEGQFDPGTGELLYYIKQARALFGLPLLILTLTAHLIFIIGLRRKATLQRYPDLALTLLIFWFYLMAHTTIYYFGILGSHGLVRVMAVIAPCLAIMGVYGFNYIYEALPTFKFKAVVLSAIITIAVLHVGYKENHYAKPYHPKESSVKKDISLTNFESASTWLQQNNLLTRTIIHQLPALNVLMNKDPYDPQSSYYIWSINKPDDWAEKGVIVVWDGFYSAREGNMPLEWLMKNPNYRLIHSINGFERPTDYPTIYDIRIFEKVNK